MAHDTFRAGDLTAVIGDNTAAGGHRAGYNGVWSLTHRTEPAATFCQAGDPSEHCPCSGSKPSAAPGTRASRCSRP
jgi:hypothetical protein